MAARKKTAGGGTDRHAGIGTEAVKKATGRGWGDWLAVLDADGAAGMAHKQIALLLREKHGVGDWWCQMVTVGYEQARGLRRKNERPDGFGVSASKVVHVPLGTLYRAFADGRSRAALLGGAALEVRKATADKSMRITWEPGPKASDLTVDFSAKGADKSRVTLEHRKLPSAAAAERMKKFWAARLAELKANLEDGSAKAAGAPAPQKGDRPTRRSVGRRKVAARA